MLNKNKRFSRSNTLFNTNLRGLLKANNKNIQEEDENKSNDLGTKNEQQIKNDVIHKKQHSDDNNLININYKAECRLQKKKKEEELEIEIDKLVKKLLSKELTDEMKDENSLIYLLMNGPNKYKGDNKNKDKLIEIMKYLLEKHQKNERDILIIKTFILKIDKLVSLFESSNITKFEIIINKLSNQLKFEEYKENNIICKEGDKGEKLYISLKGESNVLIQKEGKGGECTKFEYIKYLIILYLYQEMNMITKIIYYNKQEMKVEERCILTLFIVFRFYKYFKDYNFYLSTSKKRYDQSNIFEFVINEKKVKDFIYKKYDYPVEDSVNIFEYSHKLIKELFHFYENQIEEINEKYEDKIDNSFEEDMMNKKPTIFFKPTDLKELSTYAEYHRAKIRRNKKLKENEDILNKINSITEISKKIIYNDNIKSYIERSDFNNILRYIKENQNNNFNGLSLNLKEAKQPIKYFYYCEANLIKEGNIFGELALNNKNKKRTATIIAKKESYFAVLSKKVYDSYIKVAQIKSRIRKVLFFTEGPIFKGITPAMFLNEFYFRIKRLECQKGKILFNRGNIRSKVFFIVKGEFEISAKLTLNEIGEMIEKLGGMCDNKKEKYLCKLYDEFNNYYYNKQINIKFFVLKKNEIIGLDDMVLNDIHLFDCKCISVDESEIYEYEYKKYEEALRDNKIVNKNNVNFVNMRRKLLIENLFEQRNSLVELEYKKIKMEEEMKKKLSYVDLTKKINILNTLMKKVEYNGNDKAGPITILEKYKKKKMKKFHLDDIEKNNENSNDNINNNSQNNSNNNSKDDIKKYASSKNNIINLNKFGSEKNILTKNLLDKENGGKNSEKLGKMKSMYFPKIMSEKNLKAHLGNLESIFDKNKNINNINNDKDKIIKEKRKKNEEYKNLQINTKTTGNFKLKIDKIINSQQDFDAIYNFKKSSYYMSLSSNSCNNFFKSLNPNNNLPKTVEKRKKRNIIPISTNCKIHLNKTKIGKNAKLGFRIPSLFKEYYKEYKTTKTRISNVDDFYLDHQENLFSVLSQRNEKDKIIIKNENINAKKGFRKNRITLKLKSKNDCVCFSDSKKREKGVMTSYKVKSVPRNVGIIDCLCLDNWAEKTQFENKYFN